MRAIAESFLVSSNSLLFHFKINGRTPTKQNEKMNHTLMVTSTSNLYFLSFYGHLHVTQFYRGIFIIQANKNGTADI